MVPSMTPPPPPHEAFSAPAPTPAVGGKSPLFGGRSRRQVSYFFAGAGFIFLTSAITRRAIQLRFKSTIPAFFQRSNQPNAVRGGHDAAEALGLATMYVASVGGTATAGFLWAMDISTLGEMRYRYKNRKSAGLVVESEKNGQVEAELEQYIAGVLARKELRMFGGKDLTEMLKREFEKEKREKEQKEEKRGKR